MLSHSFLKIYLFLRQSTVLLISSILNKSVNQNFFLNTYHFADHHNIRTKVLVDTHDIHDSDIPEYNINTVEDAAVEQVAWYKTDDHPGHKQQDGQSIPYVPHLCEVNY